ncbi:VOC family protein [Enterococcus mediterraneensis]|uniref:VOC family protein n=1 Tax=Enterococcus mediterraneensis TaxID=2364791 RepID=UPI000F0715EC|nr:VOC family protein [Enterococcus mediterraneensis]
MSPLHHISLLTKNSRDNVAFYTQILGMRFVKNTVNQDNHRMLHYYYGDYQGTPGTVVTFFIVPHLGHRYDNDHYLATIGLKIPRNSIDYWENRLQDHQIAVIRKGKELYFRDHDDIQLILEEVDQLPLEEDHQVHNEIPGDKQILGLRSTEIHVKEPEKTSEFFEKLLGWQTNQQKIQFNETDFIKILPTDTQEATHMGRGGIDHVAFAVENDDALDRLYHRAQEQGWLIEKIVSRGYFKSLYIREPGGNRMEFATLAPGFTIDEPLETLGESFALPPFLADQRAEIEANIYPEN